MNYQLTKLDVRIMKRLYHDDCSCVSILSWATSSKEEDVKNSLLRLKQQELIKVAWASKYTFYELTRTGRDIFERIALKKTLEFYWFPRPLRWFIHSDPVSVEIK